MLVAIIEGEWMHYNRQVRYNAGRMANSQDNKHNTSAEDYAGEDCAGFLQGALLLQEKWVMMIVFSLLSGPIGFSELVRRGNINTTTMTQRLNLLEEAGVVTKTIHSTMPPRTSYELTEAGLALGPVLEAIAEWSAKHLSKNSSKNSSTC